MQQAKQYIKRILLLLVAMQILNTGLFAQNFSHADNEENMINSVTEYIAEVLLNNENSFPENSNHKQQHQHHKSHHNFHFKSYHFKLVKANTYTFSFSKNGTFIKPSFLLLDDKSLQDVIFDITPPPPKA